MDEAPRPLFHPYASGSQPPLNAPQYGSTHKRHPFSTLVRLPADDTSTRLSGPRFTPDRYPAAADLTKPGYGKAIGERIIVEGRVTDENDRPIPGVMIELWQANAAGRYDHVGDQHDAPIDLHFHGTGRVFSDMDGRYRYVTIKPGAYPWRNHYNAWRPNHIHYSLFGAGLPQRLVTQMYFPGDPLLSLDPVFMAIPDPAARNRLVAAFDLDATQPEWALGYRFNIVLRGRMATPVESKELRGHEA